MSMNIDVKTSRAVGAMVYVLLHLYTPLNEANHVTQSALVFG